MEEIEPTARPTVASNLISVTAQRGANDEMLVRGIDEIADLMRGAFRELPKADELGKVYEAQHLDRHSEYLKCRVSFTARCFIDSSDQKVELPDVIRYTGIFNTLEHTVYCRCLSVTSPRMVAALERMTQSISHLGPGPHVRTTMIPVQARHASSRKEWLIFFDPPLPPHSGPYRMDIEYLVPGFLMPLLETGRDELTLYLRRIAGRRVPVDFILFTPSSIRGLRMIAKEGLAPGRTMTPLELLSISPPPPGFTALGWTDMEPNEGADYGVDLIRE